MKIVFLGNMNNLPYYVAKTLREEGYDVTLLVDADAGFLLDRPESWDKILKDNYPEWIIKIPAVKKLPTFRFAFPAIFFKKRIAYLDTFDVVILNGHWISLGAFLKRDIIVGNILAGFDLDVLADPGQLNVFHYSLKHSGTINKLIPFFLADMFFRRLIKMQRDGIRRAVMVNYYATGINNEGDLLLSEIKAGQQFNRLELRGFDCSKFPYKEPVKKQSFVILNVTRFFFLHQKNDNKRNDIMIIGIGDFIKANNIKAGELEIIFFNKGEDLAAARALCDENGLTPFIQWKEQVSVEELNAYFEYCDVAFDQLGEHWPGAGFFSMLTGRPLICNGRPEIFEKIMQERSPICQAANAAEVQLWLTKLYNERYLIKEVGDRSRTYVLKHFDMTNTTKQFVEALALKK